MPRTPAAGSLELAGAKPDATMAQRLRDAGIGVTISNARNQRALGPHASVFGRANQISSNEINHFFGCMPHAWLAGAALFHRRCLGLRPVQKREAVQTATTSA